MLTGVFVCSGCVYEGRERVDRCVRVFVCSGCVYEGRERVDQCVRVFRLCVQGSGLGAC